MNVFSDDSLSELGRLIVERPDRVTAIAAIEARGRFVDRATVFGLQPYAHDWRTFRVEAKAWIEWKRQTDVLHVAMTGRGVARDPLPRDPEAVSQWSDNEVLRLWIAIAGIQGGHVLLTTADAALEEAREGAKLSAFSLGLRVTEVIGHDAAIARAEATQGGVDYPAVDAAARHGFEVWRSAVDAETNGLEAEARASRLEAAIQSARASLCQSVHQYLSARESTVRASVDAEVQGRLDETRAFAARMGLSGDRTAAMLRAVVLDDRPAVDPDLVARASQGDLEALALIVRSTKDEHVRRLLTSAVVGALVPHAPTWMEL